MIGPSRIYLKKPDRPGNYPGPRPVNAGPLQRRGRQLAFETLYKVWTFVVGCVLIDDFDVGEARL